MVDFTGGTWRSLIDGSEVSAIPDTVVDRFPADEGGGQTLANSIGPNDASLNFDNWVSDDNWIGGTAPLADGNGDNATFEPSQEFNSALSSAFGVSFAVETTDTGSLICGSPDGSDQFVHIRNEFNSSGEFEIHLRDSNDDDLFFRGETDISDGQSHTVTAGVDITDPSNPETMVVVDGSEDPITTDRDEGVSEFDDFVGIALWERFREGSLDDNNIAGVLDDIRLWESMPTLDQAQEYHDDHPSSD